MQVLYVTDFEVEPQAGDSLDDAAQECLSALGSWIVGPDAEPLPAAELMADGACDLPLQHQNTAHRAEWTHLDAGEVWATRCERRSTAADGSQFSGRVTVARLESALSVRITLGREAGTASLTPSSEAKILQPRLVSDLAAHPRLRLRAGGQVQDGRYIQVRDKETVGIVAESLATQTRLPILLVHTRTEASMSAVKRAAARLIGMARVVTLDYRSARLLQGCEPRADVPYEGGLMVWADIDAPATVVPPEVVNSAQRDDMLGLIVEQVAPLSVLARGSDTTWATVQRIVQRNLAAQAANRTAEAVESGRSEEIIAALKAERDRALKDLDDALIQWQAAEDHAADTAVEAARYKAQAEQMRIASQYAPRPPAPTTPRSFDDVPALLVGESASLEKFGVHLEQASEGRIVFTTSALSAWSKAKSYPTPELMQIALTKLARVARDLYDGTERTFGHTDTWIRETYDLKVSLQDDQMPKAFRSFTWEETNYDRTPHIKVNDGVPPDACGRVYFAFDKKNGRIVVDHVGLHY
jgi:hypothetical protein